MPDGLGIVARFGIAVGAAYILVLWLSLVYWVYRDVRSRTNDSVSQFIAVLLVLAFNVFGLAIYLFLRPSETMLEAYERSLEEEAMLQELERNNSCTACRRRVQDDYLLCPYCRTPLREPCAHCGRPLNLAWVICPYCATERSRLQASATTPPATTKAAASRAGPRKSQSSRSQV